MVPAVFREKVEKAAGLWQKGWGIRQTGDGQYRWKRCQPVASGPSPSDCQARTLIHGLVQPSSILAAKSAQACSNLKFFTIGSFDDGFSLFCSASGHAVILLQNKCSGIIGPSMKGPTACSQPSTGIRFFRSAKNLRFIPVGICLHQNSLCFLLATVNPPLTTVLWGGVEAELNLTRPSSATDHFPSPSIAQRILWIPQRSGVDYQLPTELCLL